MPLEITPQQRIALERIHQISTETYELLLSIADSFNEKTLENPELALKILENLCIRAVAGEQEAVISLISHLENFGRLGCLTSSDVIHYSIQAMQIELPKPSAKS
ncbi:MULTISPECIES: hypothetical protein [Pseudomonas syringae group]|uniref:Uncharacterized protein n=2 Tax=Pseudomonas avellanae TaxID=46257 RepID=A0AAD0E1R1_9PSED|nr:MULTISPECIES: hypothetical protein [Pseudomonas syringae group]AVB22005.1 hypothetical protein BKM03_24465 [Pseudomonas avellanae]EGH14265.1 hypothetical protein PSYMP_27203 [Pseudomonas amygdali pv. morsprunorum str. M302280]KWS61715.1 hypothetical protein AL055_27545 [Pseudomonas amygdali pv. morsprunorum]PHN36115.1 hypothetical protein AO261_01345 [Pseudomonas avellanae]POC94860.1 hypothetical protein BKM26_08385 [Pseudomonas avellanae]